MPINTEAEGLRGKGGLQVTSIAFPPHRNLYHKLCIQIVMIQSKLWVGGSCCL